MIASIGWVCLFYSFLVVAPFFFGFHSLAPLKLAVFFVLAVIWEFARSFFEEKAKKFTDISVGIIFAVPGFIIGTSLVTSILLMVAFNPAFKAHVMLLTVICSGLVSLLVVLILAVLVRKIKKEEKELREVNAHLESALQEIKELSGLLPICAWCKRMRNDQGYWIQLEKYVEEFSKANVLESLCPECEAKNKEGKNP